MRDNGCSGCKYEHLKGSEKPCCDCANMHMDKYEPITNADRIRNMSDDELAELLHNISPYVESGCPIIDIYIGENVAKLDDSHRDILEWLQSEAE